LPNNVRMDHKVMYLAYSPFPSAAHSPAERQYCFPF
jgi:hypothetical protein